MNEEITKTKEKEIELIIFLRILSIIVGLLIALFILLIVPMGFIETDTINNFCINHNFEKIGSDKICVITQDRQVISYSDKSVICKWGFYKVYNCTWKEPPKIIKVGDAE